MLDVTRLILQDHEDLRRRFADLDSASTPEALAAVWAPLADLLDIHAACEEEVFYPVLLKVGEDAEDEAEDAITDHNKIRDAVSAAAKEEIGSDAWWKAVNEAREENGEHIAEEEAGALPDFSRSTDPARSEQIAVAWLTWRSNHRTVEEVDVANKDADTYLEENS